LKRSYISTFSFRFTQANKMSTTYLSKGALAAGVGLLLYVGM
jgi:hypothetical protein